MYISGGGGTSLEQKPDEFVKKDKKLSTVAKIGIGVGIAGLIGTVAYLIYRGRISEAKQLAETIEFKPATTVKEAIEFGKTNLGVKNYVGFEEKDLDVLNWVNQGITNVSNKHKGKLRVPKTICYQDMDENTLAGVIMDKSSKYNGYFCVNKKIFSNVDNYITQTYERLQNNNLFHELGKGQYAFHRYFDTESIQELAEEIAKYKKGELKTFNQKINFINSLKEFETTADAFYTSPMRSIKALLKDKKDFLASKGLITDIEEIKKLSTEKQFDVMIDMINELEEHNQRKIIDILLKDNRAVEELTKHNIPTDIEEIRKLSHLEIDDYFHNMKKVLGFNQTSSPIKIVFDTKNSSEFDTIYHEMWHLQDSKPRCKTTNDFGYDYSKYPQDLKDWVDNQEYMQTASRISQYSCSGPGEFIAEFGKRYMNGVKISEEAIALYNKLQGPALP